MPHTTENPWQLFESVRGWRLCSKRLDDAMIKALAELDKSIASGHAPLDAARRATTIMEPVMMREQRFGAADSEGQIYMAEQINAHLIKRHGYAGEYIERFYMFT